MLNANVRIFTELTFIPELREFFTSKIKHTNPISMSIVFVHGKVSFI